MFCRECGKQIEEGARFCRFCGKSQAEPGPSPLPLPTTAGSGSRTRQTAPSGGRASSGGFEARLRQIFPRHHLQDEFMHIATIAAFFVALIGFLLGLFVAVLLGMLWLLFAIALILFLILRESTLSHVRGSARVEQPASGPVQGRYHAARRESAAAGASAAAEAATAESSPPGRQ